LRSISTAVDGGTLVLYAVAAAVVGGTSLFGGRGKAVHGVLGGIVVAAIFNCMGLLGFQAASQYMVTALVLLAAVIIDAVTRRNRPAGRCRPSRAGLSPERGRRRRGVFART
jgi:D-xylose transport system permease protein